MSGRIRNRDTTGIPHVLNEVFVGNTCIEDNVVECAEIALWKAIGDAKQHLAVTVEGRVATLVGKVASEAERRAAAQAVVELNCIDIVDNRVIVDPAMKSAAPAQQAISDHPRDCA